MTCLFFIPVFKADTGHTSADSSTRIECVPSTSLHEDTGWGTGRTECFLIQFPQLFGCEGYDGTGNLQSGASDNA